MHAIGVKGSRVDTVDELERGREAYRRRGWLDAFKSLTLADEAEPLAAPDLELLGTAAYLIGRTTMGCARWSVPTTGSSTPGNRSVLPGARSGWASASCR